MYITAEDQFILICLPQGIQGSEIKVRFTKAAQMGGRTQNPVHVQFCLANNCSQSTKMFGVFENMAVKHGNVLYRIDPCLSQNSPINPKKTWCAGIDVSHNGWNNPSTAVLTMMHDPFEGSLRNCHHVWHMNPPRKEVISYTKMWSLVDSALERSWHLIDRNPARLPEAIWFFRDGIADGQIREMNSKEVVGVLRAIREFAKRNNIKLPNEKKAYNPKVQFVVVQKTILDRFGEEMPDQRLQPPKQAAVIFDYILSVRLWDFVAWYNTRGKNRPLRYIIVKDGLNLANGGAVDAFQFCYALCFMYAYSVPFPLGNPNQPAPIKYAKHFAEIISQQILTTDRNFDTLQTPDTLNRPHLCVTNHKETIEE